MASNDVTVALGPSGEYDYRKLMVDSSGYLYVTPGASFITQYTEGDTDASITGTALMMEGAGNSLVPAQGTVANGLLVDVSRVLGAVAISAASLPLPSGASTAANQTTINSTIEFGNLFFGDTIRYASLTQASTTDTWTFKTASAGTTVAVIVITYTDSTKATISNVERTT